MLSHLFFKLEYLIFSQSKPVNFTLQSFDLFYSNYKVTFD